MTQLAFDAAHAVVKKISINVLGKDAEHTLFTLPLEGIELTREQLNSILGDRTFEAWYQQKADGSWHPMEFWRFRKNGSYEIDDEFTGDELTLTLSGDKEIEFETEEVDEEEVPAAKLHTLAFKPTAGGITLLSLHLQVRPGLGKDNLALQNHQYRPIRITLGEAKRKERKGQQAFALTNGNGTPAGVDASDGQRPVSGGFVQTKSAEEIDAEMRRRHPETPTMGEDEHASRQQAAAASGSSTPIDGTTEKSRAASRAGRGTRHR